MTLMSTLMITITHREGQISFEMNIAGRIDRQTLKEFPLRRQKNVANEKRRGYVSRNVISDILICHSNAKNETFDHKIWT